MKWKCPAWADFTRDTLSDIPQKFWRTLLSWYSEHNCFRQYIWNTLYISVTCVRSSGQFLMRFWDSKMQWHCQLPATPIQVHSHIIPLCFWQMELVEYCIHSNRRSCPNRRSPPSSSSSWHTKIGEIDDFFCIRNAWIWGQILSQPTSCLARAQCATIRTNTVCGDLRWWSRRSHCLITSPWNAYSMKTWQIFFKLATVMEDIKTYKEFFRIRIRWIVVNF